MEAALQLAEFAKRERRRNTRYIRLRFGAEVHATEGDVQVFETEMLGDRIRIVGRGGYRFIADISAVWAERWVRNLGEVALLDDSLLHHVVSDTAYQAMFEVGWDVKEAGRGVEDMSVSQRGFAKALLICSAMLMRKGRLGKGLGATESISLRKIH